MTRTPCRGGHSARQRGNAGAVDGEVVLLAGGRMNGAASVHERQSPAASHEAQPTWQPLRLEQRQLPPSHPKGVSQPSEHVQSPS